MAEADALAALLTTERQEKARTTVARHLYFAAHPKASLDQWRRACSRESEYGMWAYQLADVLLADVVADLTWEDDV